MIGRDARSEALREAHRRQVTEVAQVLHTQGRDAALRRAGRLAAGSAARVLPGGSAGSTGEAGSRTGEPSQRPDADLDDLYGPVVGPKKVKDHELYPGEHGTVRPNPLLTNLDEVPPTLLTADRGAAWLYVVTEDGDIALGTENVTGVMGEEEFRTLLEGVQRAEPDMTPQRLRELLDGVGHTGVVVQFGRDGDSLVGLGRVAGEFAWNEKSGAWTVNDKSGRYMSAKVRPGLTAEKSAQWLANVASRFSDRLGVEVRPVPYKERPEAATVPAEEQWPEPVSGDAAAFRGQSAEPVSADAVTAPLPTAASVTAAPEQPTVQARFSSAVANFGTVRDGTQGMVHIEPVPEETVVWLQDQVIRQVEGDRGADEDVRAAVRARLTSPS